MSSFLIGLAVVACAWIACGHLTWWLAGLRALWHPAEASFMWWWYVIMGPAGLVLQIVEYVQLYWAGKLFCKVEGCNEFAKTYDGYCTRCANQHFWRGGKRG